MLASMANVLGFKRAANKAPSQRVSREQASAAAPVPSSGSPSSPPNGQSVAERRRMALRPPSFTDMLP